jgi:hypothetical protein
MSRSSRTRPAAAALFAVTMGFGIVGLGVVGLGACTSSDAQGETTVSQPNVTATASGSSVVLEPTTTQARVATVPPATVEDSVTTTSAATPEVSVATAAPTTDVPAQVASETLVLTDEEVADLERQLDEIDQLLAGVDADLSQD